MLLCFDVIASMGTTPIAPGGGPGPAEQEARRLAGVSPMIKTVLAASRGEPVLLGLTVGGDARFAALVDQDS